LLLTVQTRIAGQAEMAVWLHSVDAQPATTGTGARGSDLDLCNEEMQTPK
jgi:hypothetical protein